MAAPTTGDDDMDALLEDVTLGELAEQGAETLGDHKLTQDEMDGVQTRAREIVDKARADGTSPLDGMEDMHKLTLSIGVVVPRVLFAGAIAASTATAARKKSWMKQIGNMDPDVGCIKVDFLNSETGDADVAYLRLEECGADHDLGAQLEKLYAVIKPENRAKVMEQLSMIVFLGRSAYGQMFVKLRPILDKIARKVPANASADASAEKPFAFRDLEVDYANTTLHTTIPGTRRVGIFVRLSAEVDE